MSRIYNVEMNAASKTLELQENVNEESGVVTTDNY